MYFILTYDGSTDSSLFTPEVEMFQMRGVGALLWHYGNRLQLQAGVSN